MKKLFTLIILLVSCLGCRQDRVEEKSSVPTGNVYTVEHDNHKWILFRESIVHHPDCSCEGEPE